MDKVEDLVKSAIMEALEKRKVTEKTDSPIGEPVLEPVISKTMTISEGFVGASTLFSTSVDFPVRIFKDTDWHESVRGFIPVQKDDYLLVPEQAEAILRAWELKEKVLIYGPTGAGKSSIVEQLCAITKRPFIRINCTGDMDSSMVFGQLTAKDGSTVWVDGPVTEAVKHGAVFAWDEWDVTPPEISMGLQWLLEDEGKLFLKEMPGTAQEKFLVPHENFRIVAIGNTQGQGDDTGSHAGTNVQNTATLDRFDTAIRVGYLAEHQEISMLKKKWISSIPETILKNLVKIANLVRQGYQSGQLTLTMSPRSLLAMCRKLSVGLDLASSFDVVYCNKLTVTQQRVARELYRKVVGTGK